MDGKDKDLVQEKLTAFITACGFISKAKESSAEQESSEDIVDGEFQEVS
jgi:hypothetical protein